MASVSRVCEENEKCTGGSGSSTEKSIGRDEEASVMILS